MSAETAETQRKIFQTKNRNELIDIAYAMGGRPSSRSRKSELVDLIVGLAGFGEEDEAEKAKDGDPSGHTKGGGALTDSGAATGGATTAAHATGGATTRAAGSEVTAAGAAGAEARRTAGDETSSGQASGNGSGAEGATSLSNKEATPKVAGVADRLREDGASGKISTASGEASKEKLPSPSKETRAGKTGTGESQANRRDRGDVNNRGNQSNADASGGERGKGERPRHDESPEAGGRRRRRRGGREDETWNGELVDVSGYLDLRDEGYGFLRVNAQVPSREDIYVSVKHVRSFGIRKGDRVTGASRPGGRSEKNPALLRLDTINGQKPEEARKRPKFEELTPLFPDERLRLERDGDSSNMTTRIIDLLAPIGKGQRGLIVSPPKAGKTTVMKEIARSIETNNPECKLLVLLVDERPEEVTDMRRWLKRGEVAASTFDRPAEEHTQVAELTIERAKRLVEMGEDVIIMLDGITRLARAYNLAAPATGRIMTGGVDSGALYPPKKFFGAARNMEEGGSLTILATALVETGSKMDEVIFEEFKGTGNMELRLDRRAAERRIYPAINVDSSSTRHEELLFERRQLQQVWKLRRVLSSLAGDHGGNTAAGLELLIDRLKSFPHNRAFLEEVARGPMGG